MSLVPGQVKVNTACTTQLDCGLNAVCGNNKLCTCTTGLSSINGIDCSKLQIILY